MIRMPGDVTLNAGIQGGKQLPYRSPAKTQEEFLQELLMRHQQLPQNAPEQQMQRQLPDGTIINPPEVLLQELLAEGGKKYSEKAADKKILLQRQKDTQSESTEKLIQRLLQHQPKLAKELNKSKEKQEQAK